MQRLEWSEALALGQPVMDADHEAAVAEINAMGDAVVTAPDQLAQLLGGFLDHSAAHFAREEELMQRYGFPAYPMHLREHQRVLAELESVIARLAAGETAAVHAYVREALPAWLVQHLHTMDAVTAAFIQRAAQAAG